MVSGGANPPSLPTIREGNEAIPESIPPSENSIHSLPCIYCVLEDYGSLLKLNRDRGSEAELKELALTKLHKMFGFMVDGIGLNGYYKEEATLNAVMKAWRNCQPRDTVSDIVASAMRYLFEEISSSCDDDPKEKLLKYMESSLDNMLLVIFEAHPSFNKGDALWLLLMAGMNIPSAILLGHFVLNAESEAHPDHRSPQVPDSSPPKGHPVSSSAAVPRSVEQNTTGVLVTDMTSEPNSDLADLLDPGNTSSSMETLQSSVPLPSPCCTVEVPVCSVHAGISYAKILDIKERYYKKRVWLVANWTRLVEKPSDIEDRRFRQEFENSMLRLELRLSESNHEKALSRKVDTIMKIESLKRDVQKLQELLEFERGKFSQLLHQTKITSRQKEEEELAQLGSVGRASEAIEASSKQKEDKMKSHGESDKILNLDDEVTRLHNNMMQALSLDERCIVCSIDEPSVTYIPCGHKVLCWLCEEASLAEAMGGPRECPSPFCKATIQRVIHPTSPYS